MPENLSVWEETLRRLAEIAAVEKEIDEGVENYTNLSAAELSKLVDECVEEKLAAKRNIDNIIVALRDCRRRLEAAQEARSQPLVVEEKQLTGEEKIALLQAAETTLLEAKESAEAALRATIEAGDAAQAELKKRQREGFGRLSKQHRKLLEERGIGRRKPAQKGPAYTPPDDASTDHYDAEGGAPAGYTQAPGGGWYAPGGYEADESRPAELDDLLEAREAKVLRRKRRRRFASAAAAIIVLVVLGAIGYAKFSGSGSTAGGGTQSSATGTILQRAATLNPAISSGCSRKVTSFTMAPTKAHPKALGSMNIACNPDDMEVLGIFAELTSGGNANYNSNGRAGIIPIQLTKDGQRKQAGQLAYAAGMRVYDPTNPADAMAIGEKSFNNWAYAETWQNQPRYTKPSLILAPLTWCQTSESARTGLAALVFDVFHDMNPGASCEQEAAAALVFNLRKDPGALQQPQAQQLLAKAGIPSG